MLRDLYPFLVYILTHEMVHMVRLSSILDTDPKPCCLTMKQKSTGYITFRGGF